MAHSPKDFQLLMDINVVGTFNVSHYFLPLLLGSEGGAKALVNITSISAHMSRGACAYSMSKLAMNKFTEFLAAQYGKEGLLAYAVHPGGVLTEGGDQKDVPKELLDCKFCSHYFRTEYRDGGLVESLRRIKAGGGVIVG